MSPITGGGGCFPQKVGRERQRGRAFAQCGSVADRATWAKVEDARRNGSMENLNAVR